MADRDNIAERLAELKGELPTGRTGLSEADKDALVARLGPRTVLSILKAKKELPLQRIVFLFSSLDSQDVADVLVNDLERVAKRTLAAK